MQIYKDFELSDILWYKIGGRAKYFIEATSQNDIKDAFDYIFQNNIEKYFVLGMGANLLFTDEYFDGAVIRITSSPLHPSQGSDLNSSDKNTQDIAINNEAITAFSGVTLDSVIVAGFENNLIGLEWAGGLPGTVGAAIRGNAGAFGGEIKDITKEVTILRIIEKAYNQTTLANENLNFGYRTSIVKQEKNLVVLSAVLQLKSATEADIEQAKLAYNNNIFYRKTHHPDPYVYPNTGSAFKNIRREEEIAKVLSIWPDIKGFVKDKWHGKISVGYINNRLGFAGYKIGNAQVSPLHANFILNMGKAKAADVEAIIVTIQKKYQETFGFIPEPEVEIVHP